MMMAGWAAPRFRWCVDVFCVTKNPNALYSRNWRRERSLEIDRGARIIFGMPWRTTSIIIFFGRGEQRNYFDLGDVVVFSCADIFERIIVGVCL